MNNKQKNYIDGFVFPVPGKYLADYQRVAEQVAAIWKKYGAIEYVEFVGDDVMPDIISFPEALNVKDDEVVIFGWVVFPSKVVRDDANEKVPLDPGMSALVGELTHEDQVIFDVSRMVYGGFKPLVQVA